MGFNIWALPYHITPIRTLSYRYSQSGSAALPALEIRETSGPLYRHGTPSSPAPHSRDRVHSNRPAYISQSRSSRRALAGTNVNISRSQQCKEVSALATTCDMPWQECIQERMQEAPGLAHLNPRAGHLASDV